MKAVSAIARRRARVLTVAALVTVVATGLMTSTGSARVVAETKVTIRPTLDLYHGKVKSDFMDCIDNRKVFLFRKQSGDDQKIGKDRASGSGFWQVDAPGNLEPGDKFYAKVRNYDASPPGPGTGLGCVRDKSPVITFIGD